MSDPITLGPDKKWRLHVLTNIAVSGPGEMGIAEEHGTNTDVVLTFPKENQLSAPETSSPVPYSVAWTEALIIREDQYDDVPHRGRYWARLIPGAVEDHPLVQIAQVGYLGDWEDPKSIRLFSGRLQTYSPLMFFGHGAGNDNLQNLSFILTLE